MRTFVLSFLLLSLSSPAHSFVQDFTENGNQHREGIDKQEYDNFKSKSSDQDKYYGGFRDLYRKFNEKVVVPGFISSAPQNEIAKIVGPDVLGTSFRVGDTIYLRWGGGASPAVGAIYSTYTPAIVSQNMANPTDFMVGLAPTDPSDTLPKENRLAGYFFEGTGRVRITKVGQSLVEAVIERQMGQIKMGDKLMPPLPIHEALRPSYGSIPLSAAIVCGSPPDRISTTRNSFIYINRGSRDGIKVGQMFEAVERVQLDGGETAAGPEVSAGEAIVVYVSDSYSTAMITKQFDVIRMGSLLRTMNPLNPTVSKSPFSGMASRSAAKGPKTDELPELPSLDDEHNNAPNLPDPMRKMPEPNSSLDSSLNPKKSALSELDALERSHNFQNLSAEEKSRLSKLSRQERVGETGPKVEGSEDAADPSAPGLESSFAKSKKPTKKPAKKTKHSNDEEELNMLMMQN
ncbi:MAG: hypothetical protein AB7K68_01280 [Bacteriovoracia bacterium]